MLIWYWSSRSTDVQSKYRSANIASYLVRCVLKCDANLHRSNQDTKMNNPGRELIDTCHAMGLCIVNGRFWDDKSKVLPCCSNYTNGNIVADYVISWAIEDIGTRSRYPNFWTKMGLSQFSTVYTHKAHSPRNLRRLLPGTLTGYHSGDGRHWVRPHWLAASGQLGRSRLMTSRDRVLATTFVPVF